MFTANATRTTMVLLMAGLLGLSSSAVAETGTAGATDPNATAQSTAEAEPAPQATDENVPTIEKLIVIRNLRCDAIDRAKAATVRANIKASEVGSARNPVARISAERQLQAEQSSASSAYEEASALRRRLTRMVERYTTALQADLDSSEDQAEQTRLQNRITEGQDILERGCNAD